MQNIGITALAALPRVGLHSKIKRFKKNLGSATRVTQVPGHRFFIAGYIKFFLRHARCECNLLFIMI